MPTVFFMDKEFVAVKSEPLSDEAACLARAAAAGATSFQIDDGPRCYWGKVYNAAEISRLAPNRCGKQEAQKNEIEQLLKQAGQTHAALTTAGQWLVPCLPRQTIYDPLTQLPVLTVDEKGTQTIPQAPERPADSNPCLISRLSRRLV